MACIGLSLRQIYMFVLGWLGYAVIYFLRKPLGVVKGDMQKELDLTSNDLGWMDAALILPYAVFQMTLGSLGDQIGAGYTFGVCLILDGIVMCSFGWWSRYEVFIILLFLNGTFQAFCWPNAIKVLVTWFPSGGSRGTVFGMFGTSAFAGGFLATTLVVYLQTTYTWRSAFFLPSVIVSCTGIVVLLTYKEAVASTEEHQTVKDGHSPIGKSTFKSLWYLRCVPEVAIAALCIKVVRYAIYSWLPLFLNVHLKYTTGGAGMFSTVFDIGGVAGSAFIGVFINKFFQGRCLPACVVAIIISTASLGLFMLSSNFGVIIHSVLLFLAGAFNCGPDTILASLVAADIGNRDGRNSASAVTGLVNGFGSMGSVIQGPVIGWILSVSGWMSVLLFIVVISGLGALATLRASVIDSALPSPTPEKESLPI